VAVVEAVVEAVDVSSVRCLNDLSLTERTEALSF
jgi:hypothetical protein